MTIHLPGLVVQVYVAARACNRTEGQAL